MKDMNTKQFIPSSFQLKKKIGDRISVYGGSRKFESNPDSNSYKDAAKLVQRFGWIPYANNSDIVLKALYEDLKSFDLSVYETELRKIDPVSHAVGDAMKEFLNSRPTPPPTNQKNSVRKLSKSESLKAEKRLLIIKNLPVYAEKFKKKQSVPDFVKPYLEKYLEQNP